MPQFKLALEERLFPSRAPHRAHLFRRPIFVGGIVLATTASFALVLSLAGVGPLALRGGADVQGASGDCAYVSVQRRVEIPHLVAGRDGRTRVALRREWVQQRVKHCSRPLRPQRSHEADGVSATESDAHSP
jgi:hypothetical protein